MTKQERQKRVLAVGESKEHCHAIVGELTFDSSGRMIVSDAGSTDYNKFQTQFESFSKKTQGMGKEEKIKEYKKFLTETQGLNVVRLRHVKETPWKEQEELIWTCEHYDIPLMPGTYEKVLQTAFDPLTKRIEQVRE